MRVFLTAKTIGLDGFNLSMPKGSGIATYARNLNHALRRMGLRTEILYGPPYDPGPDPLLGEIALCDARRQPPIPQQVRRGLLRFAGALRSPLGRTAQRLTPTGAVITRQVARHLPPCDAAWICQDVFHSANHAYGSLGHFTSLTFEGGGPEVTHWTCPLPLRAKGSANLYTIHDLVPLRLPFATLDNKRRFLSMCREICATADRIVTVSEHSKRDIETILGVDEARIAVTYQSVDLPASVTERADEDVGREVEAVFGLEWRGYFLFYGAIEPKKNLARVIEAYLASGVSAPLVIIGGNAWLDEDETRMLYEDIVETRVLREGLIRRGDRVRRYDFLPFELLISLIRGAKATLLPSLYEGFGLPVLESMTLGTPVVASTGGALPEIAGDAAILADPYDTQSIRAAIVALDADAGLCDELARKGRAQAAKFSPEALQDHLAELYRPLV